MRRLGVCVLVVASLATLPLTPTTGAAEERSRGTTGGSKTDPREVAAAVDRLLVAALKKQKGKPAPLTSDAEFLRRVYLDLTGRIPTEEQARRFLDSREPNRRVQLIDELLATKQYGEQFGRVWRDWIAPAELPSEGNGGNQPIKQTQNLGAWLGQQFEAGRPWNQLVHELLTVEGAIKEKPHVLFYSLIGDDRGRPQPAGATRAIASLFLGVQLQCAECHDDPFRVWKQTDFWGMSAFFRNVNHKFQGRYFDMLGETGFVAADEKGKNSKNALPPDAAPAGAITIPKDAFKNAGQIVPAKFVTQEKPQPGEQRSLRVLLADWITARENPFFAKAFVNRTWASLFSRGFVMPIDDIRADNPASHPEVLELLTESFVASNYDVRHLLRCICQTEAYQRSSRTLAQKDAEAVAHFGRMRVRVLSADVLYDSLRLSLADPGLDLRAYDAKEAQRFGESSPVLGPYEEFARLFATNEDDPTDMTHGIPQYLALINHPRLRTGGTTVESMVKKGTKADEAITTMYLGTLSRLPTPDELAEARAFLTRSTTDEAPRAKPLASLLWVLMNRSEYLLIR